MKEENKELNDRDRPMRYTNYIGQKTNGEEKMRKKVTEKKVYSRTNL